MVFETGLTGQITFTWTDVLDATLGNVHLHLQYLQTHLMTMRLMRLMMIMMMMVVYQPAEMGDS